jgi:hypothetical protein
MTENNMGFFNQLAERVLKRYHSNADKSLWDVYQLDEDFLNLEADLDFFSQNRKSILQILRDPAPFSQLVEIFVNSAVEFTYASNQYVHINPGEKLILVNIYHTYLQNMASILASDVSNQEMEDELETLITSHFMDLRANISRFFDRDVAQNFQANIILNRAVCHEYSPEFQLGTLGIDLHSLREPVLDIGCGKSGQLVKYLKSRGFQAYGVDRVVETADSLEVSDWLCLNMQPKKWGTIISHMAFSNHFIFHHLYKHGSPEKYAQQYMAILASLKAGGCFYYCPGLPFIESYLPEEKYTVTKQVVRYPKIELPAANPISDETFYAVKVKKL